MVLHHGLIHKMFLQHGCLIKLAADKHKACLGKIGVTVLENRSQPHLAHLILIAAGVRAQIAQLILILRREESQGIILLPVDELLGVALRTDIANGGTQSEAGGAVKVALPKA